MHHPTDRITPHRQDNTYHGLCYTSRGTLAGTRNSSIGPPHEGSIRRPIAPWANALPLSYVPLPETYQANPNLLKPVLPRRSFERLFDLDLALGGGEITNGKRQEKLRCVL